jgi:hypothetical protein
MTLNYEQVVLMRAKIFATSQTTLRHLNVQGARILDGLEY